MPVKVEIIGEATTMEVLANSIINSILLMALLCSLFKSCGFRTSIQDCISHITDS